VTGKPEIGKVGALMSRDEQDVSPADLLHYANGSWLKATPDSAAKSNYGLFSGGDVPMSLTKLIIESGAVPTACDARRSPTTTELHGDTGIEARASRHPARPSLDCAKNQGQAGVIAEFATNRHLTSAR